MNCVLLCFVLSLALATAVIEHWTVEAQLGDVPYIVSLRKNKHFCSGSIVRDNWVLTTASCTFGKSLKDVNVHVGALDYLDEGTKFNSRRIINHPDFNEVNRFNDVSVIQIDGKFTFSDVIKPINISRSVGASTGILAGWGLLGWENITKLQLKPFTTLHCVTDPHVDKLELMDGMICSVGSAECEADLGSPFVIDRNVHAMLSSPDPPFCADRTVSTEVGYHHQ